MLEIRTGIYLKKTKEKQNNMDSNTKNMSEEDKQKLKDNMKE